MQRKTFTRTLVALAAAALLPLAAHAQAIKMTLGHGAAVGNPRHEAAVKFAELVKAKTGGRIEVQVAPSAQLGDDAAMVTALRTGALDCQRQLAGRRGQRGARVRRLRHALHVLQRRPQAFKLLDGPLGKELADKSAEKGMIVLGYWDNGIRQMTNSKRPITKVEDMKGLKMRMPARRSAGRHHDSAGCRGAADQVRRALRGAAARRGRRPGEPAGRTSTPASCTRCRSTWR